MNRPALHAITRSPASRTARLGTSLSVVAVAAFLLAACNTVSDLNPFSGPDKVPLKGERIPVMIGSKKVEADPKIADLDVSLPTSVANTDWPQPGGNARHAMEHLSLADGPKQAFSISIGSGSSDERRLLASPIVAGGVIYTMDAEATVRASNATSGAQIWSVDISPETEEEGDLGGGIAYDDGRIFVTTGFAQVVALDAATGKEIWREKVSAPMRAGPTVADGTVFAITVDNRMFAMSAEDGQKLWQHAGIAEVAGILGGASPAVDNKVILVPHSSGEIFALRTANGRMLWSESLAVSRRVGAVAQLADIRANPVIDGGTAFVIGHSGRMTAIAIRTGGRIWVVQIGGIQTPWVAGRWVFAVTTDGIVVAVARDSGRVRWTTQLQKFEDEEDKEDPIVWAGPVLAGDRLIVAGSHGVAVSVSPYSGEILGKIDLPDDVFVAPIVANNTVYFLTEDGQLVGYR